MCAAFAAIAAALRTTHRRALLLSPASLYPLAARAEPLPAGRKELYALVCAAAWVHHRAAGVADDGDAAFLLTTRVKRPLLRVLAPSPAPPETPAPPPAAAPPSPVPPHFSARSADARRQLDPVPELLKARRWDAVRAILITPPLSDCWGKNARPLLRDFAAALGDSGGDELAALEAREDAMSHLRYLDMAVYNNVFSPAGGDAAVSASKDLVRQYVELPAQELAASTKALDILVDLGKVK